MAVIDYKTKKYNLLQIMHKMSVERYRYVYKVLPGKLSISESLFRKWLYLDQCEDYEIPHSKLLEIGQLLAINPQQLINYTPPQHKQIISNQLIAIEIL